MMSETTEGAVRRDTVGAGAEHPLVVLVSAGSGAPSSTDMLLSEIAQTARRRLPAASVTTIGLRELAIDIAKGLVSGYISPELQRAFDQVVGADALVVGTPIYKATFSGLFKSFFDLLDKDALYMKPVVLAATGQSTRHALAVDDGIRPLFAFMRAVSVPTSLFATPGDWGAGTDALVARIELAVDELVRLMPGAAAATGGGAGAARGVAGAGAEGAGSVERGVTADAAGDGEADVTSGVSAAETGCATRSSGGVGAASGAGAAGAGGRGGPVRHGDREQSVGSDADVDAIRLDTDLMRLATGGEG